VLLFSVEIEFSKKGLIRRRIESNLVTAAELGSTQADYKEM